MAFVLPFPIRCFADFCAALRAAGFSMGGGNDEGIFTLCSQDQFADNIAWHTGDPETDPWEWRMRVLEEQNDIGYAKVFFRKSGYITRPWAPYFLAVRQAGLSLDDLYRAGGVGQLEKRLYGLIERQDALPLHTLKAMSGCGQEDKARFDRALTALQMRMDVAICGRQRKTSALGEAYGWSSTMFCTAGRFWGEEVLDRAAALDPRQAAEVIAEQARRLNPAVDERKLRRFLFG